MSQPLEGIREPNGGLKAMQVPLNFFHHQMNVFSMQHRKLADYG